MVPIVLEVVATIVIVLSLVVVSLVVLPAPPAARRSGRTQTRAVLDKSHATMQDVRAGS